MAIRTLGVDIGIASIGWAIVEGEVEGDKIVSKEIIDSGVRIFTRAEHPKEALPRRMARGARKGIRRKRARMFKIKNFLASSLNIPLESMLQNDSHPPLFRASKDFLSPWTLRIDALNRLLSKEELARVILHIAKSRGYDDITYGLKESQDEESGKIAKAIQGNKEELEKGNYRTIGEMMAMRYFEKKRLGTYPMQWENVRNKGKQEDAYKRCIGRSELRKELTLIFDKQRELGNLAITQDFKDKLLGDPKGKDKEALEGMIFFQRPLKGFANKLGDCQHIRNKNGENPKRACKNAPSAEEFVAITKIINFLMHCKREFGDVSFDPKGIIEQCLKEAKQTKTGLKYIRLREILSLPETFAFKELDYEKKKVENTKAFISLEGTSRLNEALGDLDIRLKDQVACILGVNKDWGVIQRELQKIGLSDNQVARLQEAKLSFSHHINLSLDALYHILPLMKEGKRYDEAVEILEGKGVFHKREKQARDALPPLSELAKEDSYFDVLNPVVNRALSEFRKVLNALIAKHGKFHYFNIELTRDVSKSKKQRNEIEIKQRRNQRENDKAIEKLNEWGMDHNAKNRLKVRLWIQQNECCIYSGKKITREDFVENRLEVDHAFPKSRSLDDSQSNKVLCFISENQNKRNQTPYEWFGNDAGRWDAYVGRIYASDFEKSKKRKLVQKHFKDRNADDFLQRNFVDTGYIGRLIKTYVKSNLDFLPLPSSLPNKGIEHVRIVSGSLTSALRSWWGIGDKNRNHHLHHAQDAIMIAFIQPSIIKAYADFLRSKELHYQKSNEKMRVLSQGEVKTKLAMRWPIEDFSDKIYQSIQNITVSHRVSHKVTGALHEETICANSPIITSKTPTICKTRNYYKAYGGEQGVKKALELGKIRQINEGIVGNGEMVRVDVFKSKDKSKFYAVPIYTFDVALGKLPNKAIVTGKDKDGVIKDWLEMDANYEFCFSLFKNDAVLIETKKMKNPVLAIYGGTHAKDASMSFEHPSKFALANEDEKIFFINKKGEVSFSVKSVGIQGLKLFQKVQLSPLGEIKPCKKNKREEIKLKSSPKNV